MDKNIILKLALTAINDNMRPERLVPSYLVFDSIQIFPSTESKLPPQQHRMDAMQAARREMGIMTA